VNEEMRNHPSRAGLPVPVLVPVGIAALVAASLFYARARQGDLQEAQVVGIDGIPATSTDPTAVPAAFTPAALPPACATCPSRANCLPGGGVTPVALPPACATCPSRVNCLPGGGAPATPAALPPCAPSGPPFLQAAWAGCVRR